ncbi:hypothetical protein R3I94_014874 [Phoxinus phoxinus]|uniref:Uncharacterized protein n=1 Tax=Phoxinus phoxinus TaxID=58324 RepID=A0AAN9CRW9_9TELE
MESNTFKLTRKLKSA